MKLRFLLFTLLTLTLAACSFSLAEDITPPPDYVSPTPAPTMGPLYPAQAPDLEDGAAIYAEKCAACHGPKGLGDGEQGKQLPVTVAALGLPVTARPAAPADWFKTVTQGNIDRFMPPFSSLNDQQRWDVVAYVLSLHTTPDEIARGKQLFETNCANCPLDAFKDQTNMASLSADDIVALLKSGGKNVTALTGSLSNDDYYAVADYLRTLTFASSTSPTATLEPASPTPTAAPVEASPAATLTGSETPEAGTPVSAVESATPVATETPGTPVSNPMRVTGSISGPDNAGLAVTLHGFDHAADGSTASEVVTQTGVTDASGQFVFDGIDKVENRMFYVEAAYKGVTYSSAPATITADTTELSIPAITIYETTDDYSTLVFDQVHLFIEVSDQTAQVIGVYTFSNKTDKTIVVKATTDVPFLKMPVNAQNVSYDVTQDSAPIAQADAGFALPPSETPYGLVTVYTLPYAGKLHLDQPLALPASSMLVLVPEGIKVQSSQLTEGTMQTFQNANYLSFQAKDMKGGDTLSLDLSGEPKSAPTSGNTSNSTQSILIGIGGLGFVLIAAGAWLFLRKGPTEPESDEGEDDMETEEEVLDAIIALDDLHRAGKISDDAYQTRRAELKSRLKNIM